MACQGMVILDVNNEPGLDAVSLFGSYPFFLLVVVEGVKITTALERFPLLLFVIVIIVVFC